MRRFLPLLLLASTALAQTDAPPELDQPFAPDSMPSVGQAETRVRGHLDISFVGATAFNDRQLREGIARQIQTIEEYGLDEANAYDAVFFIESFYRKHGYSEAEATSQIEGPWKLVLTIDEGPLAHIGTVTVKGNEGFDTETISNYLLGPIRERYPRIRRDINLPFVEADIFSGVDLVRRLYASNGYLNVQIDPPTITFNSGETVADIEVTIKEGTQFRFGEIRLLGELVFSREELIREIQQQTKDIYTEGRLAAARRALEDFFEKRGYFQVTVSASADLEAAVDGKVPATFLIQPGALYKFDGITVAGTQGVRPSFIQKRLQRMTGRVYSPAAIDEAFRKLIQTGLFRNVRITPEAIEGDQVRLDVTVEEAKPKEFGIGVGFASYFGGIVSLSYRDLNLFGNGRPLSINLEANQKGYSGEVLYDDPWLFDSDYQLKLRLYAITATLKGYDKNEIGFQPSITRYITKNWKLSGFVLAKYSNVSAVQIEPESLVGKTTYTVASIGFTQTVDYRNNPTLPTSGYIFSTTIELAPNGIGDVSYLRGIGTFSYYLPVTAKSTLALGARAGIISPLSSDGLPINERFFNGGATTVRSFSEFTLGPKDDSGYPIGGQAFTVFNVEYTFPLIGDLYGAVFVDAGNVISDAGDFGLEDMRYAVGGGLRYNLPIGAIRFDYGLNPTRRQGEAQGAFHFAIGVAF